ASTTPRPAPGTSTWTSWPGGTPRGSPPRRRPGWRRRSAWTHPLSRHPRANGAEPMVKRQVPRPAELLELIQFKRPSLDARRRRLQAALTIEDLRRIAKRRTPAAAFDYTDGAAEDELSLRRARQAFRDVEFHPAILRDVSHVDTATTVFGGPSALPVGIAPPGRT